MKHYLCALLALVAFPAFASEYHVTGGKPLEKHNLQTKQRNGVSLSNSLNGYYEDVNRFVAPYVADGIRSLRVPVRRNQLWQNGAVQDAIKLNGYPTKQWLGLKPIIDFAIGKDVQVVIDDHSYSTYGTPDVLAFWTAMGKKLKETYGDNDLIVLELQNEPGRGAWDPNYAASVKTLVAAIRAAGINYPLAIGWGNWNNVSNFNKAMGDIDKIGGPNSIDPLRKIIWTAHYYPTMTGNDQAKPARPAPEIKGDAVTPAFKTMFAGCKARGIHCMITEIGLGGGARGWLANGSGTASFTGKAWFNQFSTLVAQYPGAVVGVIGWGGGAAWNDNYPFKMEYAKDAWPKTKGSEFWVAMRKFWAVGK